MQLLLQCDQFAAYFLIKSIGSEQTLTLDFRYRGLINQTLSLALFCRIHFGLLSLRMCTGLLVVNDLSLVLYILAYHC